MLYNLQNYYRPQDLDEARTLLEENSNIAIVAGGTTIFGVGSPDIQAVVDLVDLGLDFIDEQETIIHIGAMLPVERLVRETHSLFNGILSESAQQVAGWNLRNSATIGGMLVGGDIHSPLSVVMAALNTRVKIYHQAGESPFWPDVAKQARLNKLSKKIITTFSVKKPSEPHGTSYMQVGRTPSDRPIVCAVAYVTQQNSEKLSARIVIGGLTNDLVVVESILDTANLEETSQSLLSKLTSNRILSANYLDNYLGSAEYRISVAQVLASRTLRSAVSICTN